MYVVVPRRRVQGPELDAVGPGTKIRAEIGVAARDLLAGILPAAVRAFDKRLHSVGGVGPDPENTSRGQVDVEGIAITPAMKMRQAIVVNRNPSCVDASIRLVAGLRNRERDCPGDESGEHHAGDGTQAGLRPEQALRDARLLLLLNQLCLLHFSHHMLINLSWCDQLGRTEARTMHSFTTG